uniref:ATP-dependent RNA helicase n=1 Tax=Ananas comosus var. bracteatus TaxID=296719 RepID=A0A6V7QHE5_ANACO|nr:unnamed protein product [Ananas comosus var. bracteatus]
MKDSKEKSGAKENKKTTKEEDEGGRGGVFASCSFSDLGLDPKLCQHLQDNMGFQVPTHIQARAIPVVISGRHALVNAATGTGKTIVYLAPIVHLLQMREPRIERSDGTFALVLVPTRELCMQVHGIAQKLVHRFHWIVPGYIMGGENRAKEKARLRKGISILIATPGRLLDHLKNTSSFVYTNLRWIVFDEADRILELGFGKAIEEILEFLGSRKNDFDREVDNGKLPPRAARQNILLSATLTEKVNQFANISLDNPVMVGLDDKKITSGPQNLLGRNLTLRSEGCGSLEKHNTFPSHPVENYNLPAQLIQRYVKVSCGSRLVVLLSILRTLFDREISQKIVVFLSTCDAVDFHYMLLSEFQWGSEMHSEANQKQKFLDARGLDFPKVRCIIQYDSPGEASEYVHRVGRTARLGEKGEALLFLQPVEIDYLHDLEQHSVSLKEYPLQKVLDSFPLYGQKHHKKLISLDTHPWVLFLQRALERFVLTEPKLMKRARDAFCSWVRAYTAHRGELKKIFMVKKLHLGHVARSFGLKEQPSLVGRSFQMQAKKKRKREHRNDKTSVKKRQVLSTKPKG